MAVREAVLEALEKNRGKAVSGEQLAGTLGVSRAAVNKAVQALRAEGYAISAAERRGYALAPDSGILSAAAVRAALPEDAADLAVAFLPEIDSTNTEARRRLLAGETPPFLLVVDAQTGGRGRRGRTFFSPAGTGLYLSLALAPQGSAESIVSLTAAAAVAVVRAIGRCTGQTAAIKWVNDVYLDGRKVCGILTEAVSDLESGGISAIVIGAGLNVAQTDFPADLPAAGSLGAAPALRAQLAAGIAAELLRLCADPEDRSWMAEYRARSMVLGREVVCICGDTEELAIAVGIDDFGGLIVDKKNGGRETLRTGEITLRPAGGSWLGTRPT